MQLNCLWVLAMSEVLYILVIQALNYTIVFALEPVCVYVFVLKLKEGYLGVILLCVIFVVAQVADWLATSHSISVSALE